MGLYLLEKYLNYRLGTMSLQ